MGKAGNGGTFLSNRELDFYFESFSRPTRKRETESDETVATVGIEQNDEIA